MITKVKVQYFKRFGEQIFDLKDNIILAGPNNSGKSTLLQAIAVWNLAVQRWISERGSGTSQAKYRTGIPISRKDFTAIPLREMNLLWTGRNTAFGKDEIPGKMAGEHKLIEIGLGGREPGGEEWFYVVLLHYNNKEQIYAKIVDKNGDPVTELSDTVKEIQVVHVPPFSGIGDEETKYDRGYQNLLIGQGRPGDILRNLLLEVYNRESKDEWKELKENVTDLFGYELLDPVYSPADPFIVIEYKDPKSPTRKPFDLASAGSGFHQVLTLLSFFYARPASILLIDEPDAHQHINLQRQMFDRLRRIARRRNCQLIVSTHSEIILEDTDPQYLISFYGQPHALEIDTHRDQVREALRHLSSLDIISADSRQNILYIESETDIRMLREFSKLLKMEAKTKFFENPFFHAIKGRDVRTAKNHFFALKAVRPEIRGVLLLDGDNRHLPDHEITGEGLKILRWRRYEMESYLICPEVLYRFLSEPEPTLFTQHNVDEGRKFLQNELPPAVISNPLGEHEFLNSAPVSKTLLPNFFRTAQAPLEKKDYYMIVCQMQESEIHPEVKETLQEITKWLV